MGQGVWGPVVSAGVMGSLEVNMDNVPTHTKTRLCFELMLVAVYFMHITHHVHYHYHDHHDHEHVRYHDDNHDDDHDRVHKSINTGMVVPRDGRM